MSRRDLVGIASDHLTETVAMRLPFESLGPFKTLLKTFFSDAPWDETHVATLSELVTPHVGGGAWSHRLDDDLTLHHGVEDGIYRIRVTGEVSPVTRSLFDRVFEGPIRPEPTPHPLKVKFGFGGEPAPGVWYLAGDEPSDPRARRILDEPDVTDVMVAGDFVTIGLSATSPWERRLDDILALVRHLFGTGEPTTASLSRDELVAEGLSVDLETEQLHLLDPDDPGHRTRLDEALDDPDPRVRRIAVALLAGSSDPRVAQEAVRTGYEDRSLLVRRMAVDAAGDAEDEIHRATLETALADRDPWTRWRAVRALGALGLGADAAAVSALADDADFQVRFEVARVLRRA